MKTIFKAKTQTILGIDTSRNFNSYYMKIKAKSIIVIQKNQIKKLVFVNIKDNAKNNSI